MKKIVVFTVSIILILIALSLPRIAIYRSKEKLPLFCHFIFPGQKIVFKYNHSVEKTPVYEIYTAGWFNKLRIKETKFQSYGAGLPLQKKGFSKKGDFFVIRNINKSFSEVIIRVSQTPGQTISLNNNMYNLKSLAPAGKKIIIKNQPLITKLKF